MTRPNAVIDALRAATPAVREALPNVRGDSAGENPSGDVQVAADEHVDELLGERLGALDEVGSYASEERAIPVDVGEGYSVTVDPVDGSSNLGPNTTVGTVLGVYDAPLPAAGRTLVAAAVALYGPCTTLLVAEGGAARHELVVDGEVVDSEPVSYPTASRICGFSGTPESWSTQFASLFDDVQQTRKLRYTGTMAADVAQLLDAGGLLCYPAHDDRPNGVLRLQYESNPVAYLVEAAGGASTDGSASLLDVEPSGLHERIPTFLGDPSLVERVETDVGGE